jgi:hypothetical protein
MWILNRFTPPGFGGGDACVRDIEEVLEVLGGLELLKVRL